MRTRTRLEVVGQGINIASGIAFSAVERLRTMLWLDWFPWQKAQAEVLSMLMLGYFSEPSVAAMRFEWWIRPTRA